MSTFIEFCLNKFRLMLLWRTFPHQELATVCELSHFIPKFETFKDLLYSPFVNYFDNIYAYLPPILLIQRAPIENQQHKTQLKCMNKRNQYVENLLLENLNHTNKVRGKSSDWYLLFMKNCFSVFLLLVVHPSYFSHFHKIWVFIICYCRAAFC